MLTARKTPVAFRLLSYSLYSAQKNRICSLPKYCWVFTHTAHHALLPLSPFHGQEESHGKTKSLPKPAQPSGNKAEDRRGNQAVLPLRIHVRKTKRMLAELQFQILRFDIHTPPLPFKVRRPLSRTLFYSRTESLVGQENSNTLSWHHHKENENTVRVILEPGTSRKNSVWFNFFQQPPLSTDFTPRAGAH